jgi:hypothetical protein
MSRIEFLKNKIITEEKNLNEIDRTRLGFVLYKLQVYGKRGDIKIGLFNFSAYSHSTGVSVKVFIENGTDTYEVINGTYWYNESQYGFNKFTRNHGAWDGALEVAILDLKKMLKEIINQKICETKIELSGQMEKEESLKQQFEVLFNAN